MKMLKNDHVIRFFGQRQCDNLYYLFLEYADGGELFDRIGKLGYLRGRNWAIWGVEFPD